MVNGDRNDNYSNNRERDKQMTKQEKYQGLTMETKQVTHRTDASDMKGIHWDITVSKGKQSLTLEYTEGLGNFVNCNYNRRSNNDVDILNMLLNNKDYHDARLVDGRVCTINKKRVIYRSSRTMTGEVYFKRMEIIPPKLSDIIYCLSMDAQVINETFKDWVDNYGYSDDSIKAKGMYDACIKRAIELKQLGVDLDALAEEMEDY